MSISALDHDILKQVFLSAKQNKTNQIKARTRAKLYAIGSFGPFFQLSGKCIKYGHRAGKEWIKKAIKRNQM